MKKMSLLFLLFPALLWAGTVEMQTAPVPEQPVGTIDRVSMRTENSVTYEKDSIGSGVFETRVFPVPIHARDSSGVWQRLNFDAITIDTLGYTHRIVPSPKFRFEWNDSGAFRYVAKQGDIRFTPQFSRANISMNFSFGPNGLKALYTLLNSNAPDTLRWNWVVTPDTTVWKGTITNAKIKAWMDPKLSYPTATDAHGDTVHVERTATGSTMTYAINHTGFTYPIYIDPTVQDTALAATSAGDCYVATKPTWAGTRDTVAAAATIAPGATNQVGAYYDGATYNDNRPSFSFPLSGLPAAAAVDSVRMYIYQTGTVPAGAIVHVAKFALGYFVGARNNNWYTRFGGWVQTNKWVNVDIADSLVSTSGDANSWRSVLFNSKGRNAVLTCMGSDTLRVTFLDAKSITNTTPTSDTRMQFDGRLTYLKISYLGTTAPVATTVSGRVASLKFTGTLASTTGLTTVRGVKYWKQGTGDTVARADTGSFRESTFSIASDSLSASTWYLFKMFGYNGSGISYGVLDSVKTPVAGGALTVDGRTVNTLH